MDCIFCKIIRKEIPSKTIYEDELVTVIMDINPKVDGHLLIIPKKHYTDYQSLDQEITTHIFEVAKTFGNKELKSLNVKSLSLVINYGDAQEVKHFHMHLLPEYEKAHKIKRSIDENFELLTK